VERGRIGGGRGGVGEFREKSKERGRWVTIRGGKRWGKAMRYEGWKGGEGVREWVGKYRGGEGKGWWYTGEEKREAWRNGGGGGGRIGGEEKGCGRGSSDGRVKGEDGKDVRGGRRGGRDVLGSSGGVGR